MLPDCAPLIRCFVSRVFRIQPEGYIVLCLAVTDDYDGMSRMRRRPAQARIRLRSGARCGSAAAPLRTPRRSDVAVVGLPPTYTLAFRRLGRRLGFAGDRASARSPTLRCRFRGEAGACAVGFGSVLPCCTACPLSVSQLAHCGTEILRAPPLQHC